MRKIRSAIFAGVACAALAGAAIAANAHFHTLKVALPDGSIAQIRYSGDVAPKIVIAPAATQAVPIALVDPFDAAPFAMFDRVAAAMDRQADMMLRQAAALAAQPAAQAGQPIQSVAATLPAGTVQYSFVSTSFGNGSCSRNVQVTSFGPNQQPKVVSSSSGDCSAVARPALPVAETRPAQPAKVVPARYDAQARHKAGTEPVI